MTCSQCNDTGTFVPSTTTFTGGKSVTVHHPERATTCPCCDGTGERKWHFAFPNGTEGADWKTRNCGYCISGYSNDDWHCDIEKALDEAYLGDGRVEVSMYQRAGLHLGRDCPERCVL